MPHEDLCLPQVPTGLSPLIFFTYTLLSVFKKIVPVLGVGLRGGHPRTRRNGA